MNLTDLHDRIKAIKYMLSEDEVDCLYRYSSKVPEDGIIVDIGTAFGGSAFIMGMSSGMGVTVITIDPIANAVFSAKREEWGMKRKVQYLEMTSEKAVGLIEDHSVDLLFIDGIHNYEGVTNDFNWYYPKMKIGGHVIFHDYFLYGDTIGKAVDDIIESGRAKKIEIIDSLYVPTNARTGMFVSQV